MKNWKIVIVAVIVLLVIALGLVANYALTPVEVRTERKAMKATKERIRDYRLVAEEQRLIRQILEDKIAVAKIHGLPCLLETYTTVIFSRIN